MTEIADSPAATPRSAGFGLRRWEWFVFAAICAAIVWQLFIPPVVGVADNGDYHRVMTPLGLEPVATEWADRYFDHVNLEYTIGVPGPSTFPTSQILLGRIALIVNEWTGKDGLFHLMSLGAVNAAVYLLGLYLVLLRFGSLALPARLLGGALLFLAATDVSNVGFFNSFYSESATLVFLVLMIGVFVAVNARERIAPWHILLYLLTVSLFAAAKPQNHPLVVPAIAAAAVWLWRQPRTVNTRALVGGGLILLVLTGVLFARVPESIKQFNRWNVLFYSVLAGSDDPRSDLEELGLDPELARYAGRSAFEEGMPVPAVASLYDHGDVVGFLLRHPGRAISLAKACASETYVKTDPINGHFTKASGVPGRTQSRAFAQWHRLQAGLLPRSLGWQLFLAALLAGGAGFALYRRGTATEAGGTAWLVGALGVMAAMQFGICVLGDGTYDVVKHLFLFQVLLDACFIAGAVWVTDLAAHLARRF